MIVSRDVSDFIVPLGRKTSPDQCTSRFHHCEAGPEAVIEVFFFSEDHAVSSCFK